VPTSLNYQEASSAADKATDVRGRSRMKGPEHYLDPSQRYDQRWMFGSCLRVSKPIITGGEYALGSVFTECEQNYG
jgi:hypothetical protein